MQTGEHHINTGETYPVVQVNSQVPKFWEDEIDKEIAKLLEAGVIAPSKSPWASRIIPVRKKW